MISDEWESFEFPMSQKFATKCLARNVYCFLENFLLVHAEYKNDIKTTGSMLFNNIKYSELTLIKIQQRIKILYVNYTKVTPAVLIIHKNSND